MDRKFSALTLIDCLNISRARSWPSAIKSREVLASNSNGDRRRSPVPWIEPGLRWTKSQLETRFPIVSENARVIWARILHQELSHDMDASSRIDICIYHQASSKKKNKKRNLVANTCCTLQDLARLQAQQQCKERSQFELTFKLLCLTS